MVALVEPVQAEDPSEVLAARLDDPTVALALNQLLDHADLLAVLVTGLSELISRGDTITDSVASGVSELRSVQKPAGLDVAQLAATAQRLGALGPAVLDKMPVLEQLLGSDLGDPRVIDVASMAARALVRGAARAQAEQARVQGIRSIVRALRDDDVARALGFFVSIAQSLGQELRAADFPNSAQGPSSAHSPGTAHSSSTAHSASTAHSSNPG